MAAVLDISPSERELESLWRSFYRNWVAASDELARLDAAEVLDTHALDTLREHERQARLLLDRYEQRMRDFRSRTAAYRPRYL
jgi:DNA gyrase inhibitor GyrI